MNKRAIAYEVNQQTVSISHLFVFALQNLNKLWKCDDQQLILFELRDSIRHLEQQIVEKNEYIQHLEHEIGK